MSDDTNALLHKIDERTQHHTQALVDLKALHADSQKQLSGMGTRITRVEQTSTTHTWIFRLVGGTLILAVVGAFLKLTGLVG